MGVRDGICLLASLKGAADGLYMLRDNVQDACLLINHNVCLISVSCMDSLDMFYISHHLIASFDIENFCIFRQFYLSIFATHPGAVRWGGVASDLKEKEKNHIIIQTRVLQFPSVFSFSRFIVSGCWFVCGVGDCTQGRTHGRLVAYSGTTAPARLQPGVKSCCVLS